MNDETLKSDVEYELEWDPKVDAAHIGVSAKDSAVTLTGYLPTYSEKYAAVRAAERIYGVKAVADEIEVRPSGSNAKDDPAITEAILHVFRWHTRIPDTLQAEVRDGRVTLRGDVEWPYQRLEAARAVRDISGVKGVLNLITVRPRAKPSDVEKRVTDALKRSADLDARSIWVATGNGTVHLHGQVHSFSEKWTAENAAAAAPGVSEVDNQILVSP